MRTDIDENSIALFDNLCDSMKMSDLKEKVKEDDILYLNVGGKK